MNITNPTILGLSSEDFKADQIAKASEGQGEIGKPSDKAVKAAKDFESFFIGYIFQTAYENMPKSDMMGEEGGGMGDDLYKSMFIQEVATQGVGKRGLGLADQIAKQIQGRMDAAKPLEKTSPAPVLDLPVSLAQISSDFGQRIHPIYGDQRFHKGIDLALPQGSPIHAAASGTVIFSGEKPGYGNTIILKHNDGSTTLYGHNDANSVVEGQKVEKGQVLGFVGHSGVATGSHLHFEVRKDGEAVDPKKYVRFEEKI